MSKINIKNINNSKYKKNQANIFFFNKNWIINKSSFMFFLIEKNLKFFSIRKNIQSSIFFKKTVKKNTNKSNAYINSYKNINKINLMHYFNTKSYTTPRMYW